MNKRYFLSILILITGLSAAASAWAATDFVPGLEFLQIPAGAPIGDVLARLYIWGIGFVALAAFLMLTAGGVRYMLAGDRDPSEAKQWMKNALYGLLLALGSYLILNTINPQLVRIKNLDLPPINSSSQSAPQGQTFICSKGGSFSSSTICDSECATLGGTCSLQPISQEPTGYCASDDLARQCPKTTTDQCVRGFYFSGINATQLDRCGKCTQRLLQKQTCEGI